MILKGYMKNEILSDIRNKLRAPWIVLERMAEGKALPESFLHLAIRDFMDAWKLFQSFPIDGKLFHDFSLSK